MLAATNDFDTRRKRLRAADPDRMALWPQFAGLSLIAAAFDEAHHGFAGDPRTMAVVLSALGESLASAMPSAKTRMSEAILNTRGAVLTFMK